MAPPRQLVLAATSCALLGALAPATAAQAAAAKPSAQTIDADHDGRIDAVRITLGRSVRVPALGVAGYKVTRRSVKRAGGRPVVTLRLRERSGHDSDARPLVVPAARGARISGVRAVRARDTAPPMLIAARLTRGSGSAATATLYFSEPVDYPGSQGSSGPLSVSGFKVTGVPATRRSPTLTAGLTDTAAGTTALVKLSPSAALAPRDRAGNAALPAQARVLVPQRAGEAGPPAPAVPTPTTPAPTDPTTPTQPGGGGDSAWHTLSNPIDPRQLSLLPFGKRSHWLQPWRAYLDTPPASQLRNAVGINFNVDPQWADQAAALLQDSGFTKARMEIGWGDMDYDHPDQLSANALSAMRTKLAALRDHGIRPLILLNSNHNQPTAEDRFNAVVTQPIDAGSRTVHVDQATAAKLVPGLSGFDGPSGKAAEFMVTDVASDGTVTLSKPAPAAIPAGQLPATRLRYAPFAAPSTASFDRTMAGWLDYVGAVTRQAKSVLGSEDFDVEVWNEKTFGADFLDISSYYSPVPASLTGTGSVDDTILSRTVSYLRDPANGVSHIGIGDGFANQTPFAAGSTSPRGLTAIDKHPYHANVKTFPGTPANNQQAVNANGQSEGRQNFVGDWNDAWTPNYRAFFPEYYLSGIQTESLVRDLAPSTETFNGAAHGRNAAPAGGTPPQMWVTETNIAPEGGGDFTAADKRHLQAKATLRTLASFVNKGVTGLYFYAFSDNDFAMVDPSAPGGGETMRAVKRMVDAFSGPSSISDRRSLSLDAIADDHDHKQFDGDGSAAHPALYNRDVTAFLPFQVDDHTFVAPSYVMTRDMGKVYKQGAPQSDTSRYDLPPENYRLTIGGVNGNALRARATDPLTGDSVAVQVVSRSAHSAVVQVPLTDSPRLLVLQDG